MTMHICSVRRMRAMSVVVACAVTAAGLSVLVPSPASADPGEATVDPTPGYHPSDGHQSVSPLESERSDGSAGPQAPERASFGARPGGERPDGWVAPEVTGFDEEDSTLVNSLTTADREVYENPDGTRTAFLSPAPVRFENRRGDWQPIDLGLDTQTGGDIAPAASPVDLVVPAESSDAIATVDEPGVGEISMQAPSVVLHPSDPAVDGSNGAGDPDAAAVTGDDGVTSLVSATPSGFEQSIVFPEAAAASPSYQADFVVPSGVTVRNGSGGVEFVDGAGAVTARFGDGVAFDAGAPGHDDRVPVSTTLVGQDGGHATVSVSVSEDWLTAPERQFPVTIDPTYTSTIGVTGGGDTYVNSGAPTTSYASSTQIRVGKESNGSVDRSLVLFNLSAIPTGAYVSSATMRLDNFASQSCTAQTVNVRDLTGSFGSTTTWNTAPGVGSTVVASESFAHGSTGCAAAWETFDLTDSAASWVANPSGNYGVRLNATESTTAGFKAFASSASGASTAPQLVVTYDNYPSNATQASPASGATVATTVPPLAITAGSDPDGDTLRYWYTVSTDPTGSSGQVLSSGWLTTTSWTPPAGALVDGATYYWTAYTWDQISWPATPPTATPFTVNLRLGDNGIWPTDQLGPTSVNLTNGNLLLTTASPSFTTVGGQMGLSYSYNSKTEPTAGLTGTYYDLSYNAPGTRPSGTDKPNLVRRDSAVGFNWGTGPAWGNMAVDRFYVVWDGYLSVPTTGTYNLGVSCDDGATITLNGTMRVDKWSSGCGSGTNWSANLSLSAGTVYPISVEFYDDSGAASINLQAKGPGLAGGGQDVPSSWLSTTAPSMPLGWSVSADLDGSIAYQSATVTATAITFNGTDGTIDRYRWDGTKKAWQPPPGLDGVIGTDTSSGAVTLLTDGQTYVFNAAGVLQSVTTAVDDKAAASAQMTYSGSPARLSSEKDPVSNREIKLYYSGDTNCGTLESGFSTPPAGMLCAVVYNDFANMSLPIGQRRTQLEYNSNGQLARIHDPGKDSSDSGYAIRNRHEDTDFAYDSAGRVIRLRDPLASDAIAAGIVSDDSSYRTETVISYNTDGTVHDVTQPVPQGSGARPKHTYTYTSATATTVDAAGLSSTTGHLTQVTFDATGRPTATTDLGGRVSHAAWDAQDRQVSAWDDSTSLKSTTIYDAQGNATDSWGPAPTSYWSASTDTGAPSSGNQAATPHAVSVFDGGLNTLAATWWNNAAFTGDPRSHQTGISTGTGQIDGTWSTGSLPPSITSTTGFSGRLTGWINLPAAGTYTLRLDYGGQARLTVANQVVVDGFVSGASSPLSANYTAAAAGWQPISIDYSTSSSTGSLALKWQQPGGSLQLVPAANLAPGYGLETSSTDADGRTTSTSYSASSIDPYLGLATSTTVDPGSSPHLDLTSTTTYEAPSSTTYLRETGHTLPSGNDSKVTTSYWGATATATDSCTGTSGINQGGLTDTVTAAAPGGSGGSGAIARATIYNQQALPAATRVVADGSAWTCMTYDSRQRTTAVAYPDLTGAVGHSVATDYAPAGNPLATTITDTPTAGTARTVTTVVDLLGQVRSHTDAWGKTTTTTYDQVGRPTTVDSPVGTQTFTFNNDGTDGPTVLDSTTYATPHYDSAGRLSYVEYANGTKSDTISRDAYGRQTTSLWRKVSDSSVYASETQSMSLGGDITEDVTDGNDPRPSAPDYLYDPAGRLTDAWTTTRDSSGTIGSRHTAYGFGTASGCSGTYQSAAGKNTNRTTQTVGDGGSAVTTSYCYDSADRLTSTTESGVGTPAYDSHGNTTAIWGESRTYDSSDRHLETTKGSTTVTYVRDGMDRLISRTAGSDVERYGYTGGGDSADFVMDGSGAVVERSLGLPGGVAVTLRSGSHVWSYPNMHGDTVVVTDGSGVKQGVTRTYDPYGNTTGQPIVDNSAGSLDHAMLGQYVRPTEHESGLAITIEMGARQYDPTLGRFIEVDPIEGGSANDYDYVDGDPVNRIDNTGTAAHSTWYSWGAWHAMSTWWLFPYNQIDGCITAGIGGCRSVLGGQRRYLWKHYWSRGSWHMTKVAHESRVHFRDCFAVGVGIFGATTHWCRTWWWYL